MSVKINHQKIKYQDCNPLDKLPALVLATKQQYYFNNSREWQLIDHQTGGTACNGHLLAGTILQPAPGIWDRIQELADNWHGTECGALETSLDEVIRYRKQLNDLLGVDCNTSFNELEEGIYPIDCSVEIIRKLCLDKIPDDLDELINWGRGRTGAIRKMRGSFTRWHFYILGDNSD